MKQLCGLIVCLLVWDCISAQQGLTPNELFKTGFAAYQQGNYDLAIKNYNLAIGLDDSRNYFYYNRGMAYKAKGNFAPALADLRRSLALKPTAEAYYQEGVIEYEKGELAKAKGDFEQAKMIRSDLENMNFYLGLIYYKDKQYALGAKCLEEFTAGVKTNADAYYYRAMCEAKSGKIHEAAFTAKFVTRTQIDGWKFYMKMYRVYIWLWTISKTL